MANNPNLGTGEAADAVIDDAVVAAGPETTEKPKKPGKAPSPGADVAALVAAALPEALAAFMQTPGGIAVLNQLLDGVGLMREPLEPPASAAASVDAAAPAFAFDKAAKLFDLEPLDVLSCRYYPDQSRLVVVTAGGQKLEKLGVKA